MDNQIIDKIAFIEIQNQKILSTRTRGKDTFYIPGGKREHAESDSQTLIREIKEELSVDILPESIAYYGTFQAQSHGAAKGILVQMTCYTAKFSGILRADHEIEELRWLTTQDMNIISEVDKLIFKQLKEEGKLL